MSNTLRPSHELTALDLLQVNIDELTLPDLEAYAHKVSDTILGLVGLLLHSTHLSPAAAANIRRLEKRLRERMHELLELIELRKLEAIAAEIEQERDAEERANAPRRMRR